MRCLDRFNQKMNLNGGSLRSENIKNSRDFLAATFFDDASFTNGVYMWELGLTSAERYRGRETVDIRMYHRTYSSANGCTVKFQTMYDTPIYVGDIIYTSGSDEFYICTEAFNVDDVSWKGKFTLCNWILKWQNANGDILEYPCYDMNITQYNSGEQSSRNITIGSSQHMVMLPYDKNTVILSTPQRFFLDKNLVAPTSFVVTQNDSTSYSYGKKGIVKVTLLECAKNNDTDRVDLGICDYFDNADVKKNDTDDNVYDNSHDLFASKFISKSIILYDTDVIKSGGSPQTFRAMFFGKNGEEIDGVSPSWKIVSDFNSSLDVEEDGNSIIIGIDDDDCIDEEFKIFLSDSAGNYESSMIVKVESLL